MKIVPPASRLWPAILTGLFVGAGMSFFVAMSSLDAAFANAPAVIGVLAGIGTFLLMLFLR